MLNNIKTFLKNNWALVFSEILVAIAFTLFFGKYGNFIIDSFREIYIPEQMLNNKVLYRDIFAIYPPLAYIINSLILKLFQSVTSSINIFYTLGLVTTVGIIYYTNRISENFFNRGETFAISLFSIAALVLSPSVFNTFLPYSYGIIYGILFILISIYYGIKKNFPISYLFYALAICAKYEFVFLLPLLVIYSKKENWVKNLIALFAPIFITLIILLMQGLRFNDILTELNILGSIANTETLSVFYSNMGLVFRLELIPIYIINIVKFVFPINWTLYQEIIIWIFPVITILLICRFKTLKPEERFFVLATLLISIKVFFALTLDSYGGYFIPFGLISLFILLPKTIRKWFLSLLIIWSLIIGHYNILSLQQKNITFLKPVIEYAQSTSKDSTILVLPEGLSLNILTNRKSDNKFYSLIPLYVETFGENVIINRLNITKPDYIITTNYDTSAYYFKEFGKDYGINIYNWIKENYKLDKTIENELIFNIYKKD